MAVRGIIRRHNGGLLVTSEKDRGTSFRVLLPVTNTPIEDSTVSDGETNLLTQTPESDWVLVIDDDDKVLRTTRRVLEERGFHTQIATDGQQATSLLRLNPRSYQLIVLNMNMPRMDGAKTLKQLRSITPSVPIVMTSGFGEDECRERLTGLAFDGYIQKPYSPEELLHCVTNVLSEHCAPKLG